MKKNRSLTSYSTEKPSLTTKGQTNTINTPGRERQGPYENFQYI